MNSDDQKHRFWRSAWLIPLIFGVVIGVAVSYLLRPSAGIASTAPANCNSKGTPVGAAHYTPGPRKGAVTPLPGATPVRPRPHLILGMITHKAAAVGAIQAQANKHNKKYAFYLNPSQVVLRTAPQYGFKPAVQLVSPPKPFPRYSGRPVRKAVIRYQGALYQVRVAQPATQGSRGIWLIVTILPQKVQLGGIGQPASVVKHEQGLADSNKKYAFYLNPTQVALHNAAQYGIVPVALASKAIPVKSSTGRPTERVEVKSNNVYYYIYVSQFGKRGPKGVWDISFIDTLGP